MIRICLADDEAEFLALMKELLGNYLAEKAVLCEIDAYENPEPLYWEFLEKREYDICFLDIEMPQMDGKELAEKWKEKAGSGFVTEQGFRVCAMQSKSTADFWIREEKTIRSGQPSYCTGEEAYSFQ